MKHWFIGLTLACLIGVVSCQSGKKDENASWAERMQQLAHTFSNLVPYVFSSENYHKAENRDEIKAHLREMVRLGHKIDDKSLKQLPDHDPSLKYLASEMDEDLQGAYDSFLSGNTEYSRLVMTSITSRCFYCHTRNDLGPQFVTADKLAKEVEMRPSDQAELYVALRDYDRAISLLKNTLQNESLVADNPFEAERAVKKALFVAVRVKRDPKLAKEVTEWLLSNPSLPNFLAEDAKVWQASISRWEKESKVVRNVVGKAKKLVKKGHKVQEYPMDSAGDVEFLRASTLLHDHLSQPIDGKPLAQVLHLLGQSYETLRDIGFWNLHEVYYGLCVREYPHSSLAADCYKSYEANVVLGYSGSSGVYLPKRVSKNLAELYKLSRPKKQ